MMESCVRNDRARQILTLLKDQGPLPSSALQLLVQPPIKKRKLRLAISRLLKNKMIELRPVKFTGYVLRYYQIHQSSKSRKNVAKLLGCNENELSQTFYRHREYLHNDGVSLLATKLLKLFPEVDLIRDFKLYLHKDALRILQYDENIDDQKPDILLRFKNGTTQNDVWVAVELEKFRKDDRRLILKLRKFAAKSHVDGVIYFCDTKRIESAIASTFDKYVSGWARRISSYKNNFVLLGDSDLVMNGSIENLLKLDQETVSLKQWISTLCVNSKSERTDNSFSIGAG